MSCVDTISGLAVGSQGFPSDGPRFDAFGRLRTAQPHTLFESKQLFDNQPLIWDDAETSGAGTTSTFDSDRASTTIAVGNTTAGTRVRQTFQRVDYQPGKSQLIYLTGVLGTGASGITRRLGQFDTNNGLFFELSGTTLRVVRRTFSSGAPVDNQVDQADWNIDPLDGSGRSGLTIDPSKTQIFCIDYEWLGVGRVRLGFVIDGIVVYCHEFLNANNLDVVYISTPDGPLRYEISNDGTGAAASLEHICSTVISEGGRNPIGVLRYGSTGGTHVDADVVNSVYAIIGIRLKTTHIGARIDFVSASLMAETNADFEWKLILNPTVAGAFAYADLDANSAIQIARGVTANTITGGTDITGGYAARSTERSVTSSLENAIILGAAIDGTRDTIVLAARPLSANLDIQGALSWRETT
jgi:hypothetical protein